MTKGGKSIKGDIILPGDKSISHRALIIGSIAQGKTEIDNFLLSSDSLSTMECLRKCGVEIVNVKPGSIIVHGVGLRGLREPLSILNAGNSGTTMRLFTGLLCAQKFSSSITGDSSLRLRPMGRVTKPLRLMNACIDGIDDGNFAPLVIKGSELHGITYDMPVASAQVKSAIILASLYGEGNTIINELYPSRNHTEIMLNNFGANIKYNGTQIVSSSIDKLFSQKLNIPSDISSAAYFMIAAAITKHSCINIFNVGINPTRTGVIDVLRAMGAVIKVKNERVWNGEQVADISVYSSPLRGITIGGELIPRIIDEIPIICIAAAFADGITEIKDAEDLKYKESNRIDSIVKNLKILGAEAEEKSHGLIIYGGKQLHGGLVDSYNDHRIAMAMTIAGMAVSDGISIDNAECVSISFPNFYNTLEALMID